MTDASFKTNAALAPQLGVVQAKTFAMAVPTPVAPDALCPTCAKEPVVTIPKTEPVPPPTSPATSPQPIPSVVPKTSAPTLPTSSFLDQELGKLRQELLQGIAPPSVPVAAPYLRPLPSTLPRPIITPALALAAPRELLWSQLGVGYIGMQPFARPMVNGGLSGTMTGLSPSAASPPKSLAVSVASTEAQAGIAHVLEYLATLQSGGSLASAGALHDVAARLSDARGDLLVEQWSSALSSIDRALAVLDSAAAANSIPFAVRSALIYAIRDGVRPPIVLCDNRSEVDKAIEKITRDIEEAKSDANAKLTDKNKTEVQKLNKALDALLETGTEALRGAKGDDELRRARESLERAIQAASDRIHRDEFCLIWVYIAQNLFAERDPMPNGKGITFRAPVFFASSYAPVDLFCSFDATVTTTDGIGKEEHEVTTSPIVVAKGEEGQVLSGSPYDNPILVLESVKVPFNAPGVSADITATATADNHHCKDEDTLEKKGVNVDTK